MTEPLLLRALKNEPLERPPVWMMRQAGRYLSEYQEMKQKHSFLELCKSPELACEITMQPIRFLSPDAAIIFADIMLPAEAMGLKIDFQPGPKVFNPIRSGTDVKSLLIEDPATKLSYVMDALRMVRRELDFFSGPARRLALLGFAGAPWTMACYLIDQGIHKHFQATRIFAAQEPKAFFELMEKLSALTESYLLAQLESGADAVQLFDTWSGNLSEEDYKRFALPFNVRIIETIKRNGGKIMLYVGGASHLFRSACRSGADGLSIDWRLPLRDAFHILDSEKLSDQITIQGNFDPSIMFAPMEEVREKTQEMLRQIPEKRRYIANLGHGILPGTPRENALTFVQTVQDGWPK